ncbi:MAG: hypothetical protein LBQ87_07030 [Candidatus Fibromonas sp.]|jgi:hypothetical protein|nr:hypothetical protein [Candidatus Fibromonas sp.]
MTQIIEPKPLKSLWIDFSEEKIEKVLFLDIDGVIQPFTEYRFEHVYNANEMERLFKELENEFKINYREFDKYDVAAAYYDWDKTAVKEIKRILDATGAKIVVSSSWRSGTTGDYLPFLLRIHGLQEYLYGYNPIFLEGFPKDKEYEYLAHARSIEILEYLKMHPHIRKWAAVDDVNLPDDFPENAVVTYPKITAGDADKCIRMLQ